MLISFPTAASGGGGGGVTSWDALTGAITAAQIVAALNAMNPALWSFQATEIDLTAAGPIEINAGANIDINSGPSDGIFLQSGQDLFLTAGANMSISGSGTISIGGATAINMIIGGAITIQSTANFVALQSFSDFFLTAGVTLTINAAAFSIFGAAGSGQASMPPATADILVDPAGTNVMIQAMYDAMRAWGWGA